MSATGFLELLQYAATACRGRRRQERVTRMACHGSVSTFTPPMSTRGTSCVRQALPLWRHLGARRGQLLRLLAATPPLARWCCSARANPSRWSRSRSQTSLPHRQCLRHDGVRPRLREHRIRLPHGRSLRSAGAATASTPAKFCSTRTPGHRRPRRLGQPARLERHFQHRGRLVFDDFDWEDDRPLEMPIEDLVVYEMHVRGFTRHPSAGVEASRAPSPASARRFPT